MKRRKFLEISTMGTFAMGVVPVILTHSHWKGANDRVNVGVIGIRDQDLGHIEEYQALNNVEAAALCDANENLFAESVVLL
jgi:hypothetical protein